MQFLLTKKSIIIISTILFIVILITGYSFTFTHYYGEICEKFGGKWASVDSKCITHSCFKSKNCGYWAFPARRCNRLKINDSISEVIFQLGDPDTISGNWYFWEIRKGGYEILAKIENERLTLFFCDLPQIVHKLIESNKINLHIHKNSRNEL